MILLTTYDFRLITKIAKSKPFGIGWQKLSENHNKDYKNTRPKKDN